MTYRTILLELRDEPANEARVRAGSPLAARFGAELVGIHVAALPTVPVGLGEASAYIDAEIIGAQREANQAIRSGCVRPSSALRDPAVPGRDAADRGGVRHRSWRRRRARSTSPSWARPSGGREPAHAAAGGRGAGPRRWARARAAAGAGEPAARPGGHRLERLAGRRRGR